MEGWNEGDNAQNHEQHENHEQHGGDHGEEQNGEQEVMDAMDDALNEGDIPEDSEDEDAEGSDEEYEEDTALEDDEYVAEEDPEDYYDYEEEGSDEPTGLSFENVFYIVKFIRHMADHHQGDDGKMYVTRNEEGKPVFGRNFRVLSGIISSQGRYGRKATAPSHVAEAFYEGDVILHSLKYVCAVISAPMRSVKEMQNASPEEFMEIQATIQNRNAAHMAEAWEMGDEERRMVFRVLEILAEEFPKVSKEQHDQAQQALPEEEREEWVPYVPKRITKNTPGGELYSIINETIPHIEMNEANGFIDWLEEAEEIWPIVVYEEE